MLSALFGARPENVISSTWGEWPGDPEASNDKHYSASEALQLMAVYGCVRLISDGISTLPIDVYRDPGDGSAVGVTKPAWLSMPTPDLSFEAWCSQVLSSLLLYGNSYVVVLRGSSAQVVSLVPLDPTKVTIKRRNGVGRVSYIVNGEESTQEIMHVKGLMLPGTDEGLSPLEYARKSVGLGLAAQRYGSDFFDNEGNMPGVIEAPGAMQPDTKRETARQWRRMRQRGGRGLPGVLDQGATWKSTGITNEQAQFLASRQFTAAEIAGQVFLVDPSDLGIPVQGTSLTYANLQDRNTRRVQVTYLPWVVRLERALSTLVARPRYVKFNVDGLLRGSLKDQFETWAIGIDKQFLVPNEPRTWLDLGTLPGGEQVVRSQNGPQ